ncbi:MAG TPA: glycogen debranching enzyme N-terminal domain-containing protein, partial [Candidatus Tectomicrobia bacterium]
MIQFGQDICTDLSAACSREWLETNGIGGFASSTIIGLNTRRYHGLLTAATKPPVGRLLLLAKLEDTLVLDGQRFDLSANQYPGVIHPQGYQYLKGFRLDPFPIFTYEVGGFEIEKSIFMVHGENSTVVTYTVKEPPKGSARLEVRPLIACRDYHSTTRENAALDATLHTEQEEVAVAPYQGLPTLYLAHDADLLLPQRDWYRSFEYAVERERGLDWGEDLFNPCTLQFDLSQRSQVALIASTERRDIRRVAAYRQAEIDRRAALQTNSPVDSPVVRLLVAAADQFIVSRGE